MLFDACYINTHLLFFLELFCPLLPTWNGVTVDSTNNSVGAYSNITCPPGQVFTNSETSTMLLDCRENGKWYPEIEECKGSPVVY